MKCHVLHSKDVLYRLIPDLSFRSVILKYIFIPGELPHCSQTWIDFWDKLEKQLNWLGWSDFQIEFGLDLRVLSWVNLGRGYAI
jgi:hypothetical protein